MSTNSRKPPSAGRGRPKGALNRTTVELRTMIENALSAAGGEKYLREQARDNPTAFLALVSKLLPKDMTVKADVSVHVRKELIDRALALMFGKPLPPIEQTEPVQGIGGGIVEPQHNDY